MWLGDLVAKATSMVGIQSCEPCKARQARLNAWHQQVVGATPPLRPGEFVIEVGPDGRVVRR